MRSTLKFLNLVCVLTLLSCGETNQSDSSTKGTLTKPDEYFLLRAQDVQRKLRDYIYSHKPEGIAISDRNMNFTFKNAKVDPNPLHISILVDFELFNLHFGDFTISYTDSGGISRHERCEIRAGLERFLPYYGKEYMNLTLSIENCNDPKSGFIRDFAESDLLDDIIILYPGMWYPSKPPEGVRLASYRSKRTDRSTFEYKTGKGFYYFKRVQEHR